MVSSLVRTDLSQLRVNERYIGYEADERGEKLWAGLVMANYRGVFAVIEQYDHRGLAVVMRDPRVKYRLFSSDLILGPTPLLQTSPEVIRMAALLLMEDAATPAPWTSDGTYAYMVACEHGWRYCHHQGGDLVIGHRPVRIFGNGQGEALRTIRELLGMCGRLCESMCSVM